MLFSGFRVEGVFQGLGLVVFGGFRFKGVFEGSGRI